MLFGFGGKRVAKKRKKRKTKAAKVLQLELIGLLCVFLSIFGSGASLISDGFIPTLLENSFRFVLGIWYFVAAVILFIIGLYLIIKRRKPVFFTKRSTGFILLFLGVLLFTHIQTFAKLRINPDDISIMNASWQHFSSYMKGIGVSSQLGGGMVGGLLFTFSYFLFSFAGAKIVAVFSIIIGFLFMTNLTIGNGLTRLKNGLGIGWKKGIEKWKEQKTNHQAKQKPKRELVTEPEKLSEEAALDVQYSFEEPSGQMTFQEEEPVPVQDKTTESAVIEEEPMIKPEVPGDQEAYELPSLELLSEPLKQTQQKEKSQIQKTVRVLEQTFDSFGVKAKITKAHVGPAVTKYEVYPEAGVKVSRILGLHDDLALALAAQDIRIEAPIPGKSAVGIEVPNQEVATVSLRELLDVPKGNIKKLLFALGRDISGNVIEGEMNKMPHLLIAGATGSGKSVCINGIIISILMRAKPHEVKMMMIDPKKVELNVYNGIPHLLTPVVTDPKKASIALKKVVAEMEYRYELFSDTGTRNLEGYNQYIHKQNELTGEEKSLLPYIVVLVDELADLMMVAASDVEDSITRLAQMARAAGIHLIIATQRPSVDVITGVIKANIPSRIAFSVSSQVDSRTILDMGGAEKLLGRGDMLYIPVGRSKPLRVQGAFLSDGEVEKIVTHCVEQQKASYQEEMMPVEVPEETKEVEDELFQEAVQLVANMQSASVSMLQRRFRIGYTRAARLIDAMEDRQIVGPYEGNKPRIVFIEKPEEEVQ